MLTGLYLLLKLFILNGVDSRYKNIFLEGVCAGKVTYRNTTLEVTRSLHSTKRFLQSLISFMV
jgi:hypothetical protein